MKTTNATRQPFIRTREVFSSNGYAQYWYGMAADLRHKYFRAHWSEARLRRHIEMLRAFGFNSLQVSVNGDVGRELGVDQDEWRKRVHFMCQTAHELGLSVSQFVWATTVVDAECGRCDLDWHQPEERARLEVQYRSAAEFAPYMDRVITHWADPGGPLCSECTCDTVVEIHNAILAAFRASNPQVRGALSTWYMQPGKVWPDYENPGQLAGHPRLDQDTDIALGVMNFGVPLQDLDSDFGFDGRLKLADLEAIVAANRRAGVWGWYTTDMEILPALHVHTEGLQDYFLSLPSVTRSTLAWHSLDDNCHGLNMQNLYVAGKLMQAPWLSAHQLLEDFCCGFLGVENAPAVVAALRAIEQARTRSLRYSVRIEDVVAPLSPGGQDSPSAAPPPTPNLPSRLPASWLSDTAEAVDTAIAGLQTVRVAPDFQPAWPVTMEPADYLEELRAHLEAIRRMLTFLEAVRDVERMRAIGKPVEQIHTAIDSLPSVEYDPEHTAGLETEVYHQKLAALRKMVTDC